MKIRVVNARHVKHVPGRTKTDVLDCQWIQKLLRLLGNASYAEMPACYAAAGAMVLPTFADEWGLVVNEALASGLPVLGSVYSSAVEDLVEDGVNGWRFRMDDPEEMYRAIYRCLLTPEWVLREMRARAREASLRISPEYVVDRIMAAVLYAKSRRRQPRRWCWSIPVETSARCQSAIGGRRMGQWEFLRLPSVHK